MEIDDACYTPSLTPDVSYHMIATCPDDATFNEHQRCSNGTWGGTDFMIPVYVHSHISYYANKFCAACNGHTLESLEFFKTLSCEWSCNEDEILNREEVPSSIQECQNSSGYILKWMFNPLPRLCDRNVPNVVINCPLQNDSISKACHSYSAHVLTGNIRSPTMYKNVHCATCNDAQTIINLCDSSNRSPPSRQPLNPDGGAVPLTILFDFTSGTLQQSHSSYGGPPSMLDCPKYFTYSREFHECRRVGCPEGATLHKKDCVYSRDPSMLVNRTLSSAIDPHYRRVVVEFANIQEINHQLQFRLDCYGDSLRRGDQQMCRDLLAWRWAKLP